MALVKCRECGKDVSTEAEACPHCGASVRGNVRKSSGCGTAIAALILGVVALMFLGMCNRRATEDVASSPTAADLSPAPAPTPALAAKVVSIECTERGGKGHMQVTIQNTGNETIPFAQAFADFTTGAGVVSDDSYFSPMTVPPGARASADMHLRQGGVTNCQLRTIQSGDGTTVQLTPPD